MYVLSPPLLELGNANDESNWYVQAQNEVGHEISGDSTSLETMAASISQERSRNDGLERQVP